MPYIFTIYMVQCFVSMYSVFDNKGCHICLLSFLFICTFHFYYFRFFVKSCSLSDSLCRSSQRQRDGGHQVSPSNTYISPARKLRQETDRPLRSSSNSCRLNRCSPSFPLLALDRYQITDASFYPSL